MMTMMMMTMSVRGRLFERRMEKEDFLPFLLWKDGNGVYTVLVTCLRTALKTMGWVIWSICIQTCSYIHICLASHSDFT